MEIISQKLITDPLDIMSAPIIDFNRLNGVWECAADAVRTIFSWFDHMATITIVDIPDFHNAPERDDWPGWDHVGGHPELGRKYWNWFFWRHPRGKLKFSDSPDFYGGFGDGALFWGDIGKVSASAFAMTQKQLRAHDLWVSVLGGGIRQVLIEPHIGPWGLFAALFNREIMGRAECSFCYYCQDDACYLGDHRQLLLPIERRRRHG